MRYAQGAIVLYRSMAIIRTSRSFYASWSWSVCLDTWGVSFFLQDDGMHLGGFRVGARCLKDLGGMQYRVWLLCTEKPGTSWSRRKPGSCWGAISREVEGGRTAVKLKR